MPIKDMDLGHVETLVEGKWVPVDAENVKMSLSVGDKKLFYYDQDAGVLKLNKDEIPEGLLEQISRQIEQNLEGIEVGIKLPFEREPTLLKGVKAVLYFTPEEVLVEEGLRYTLPRQGLAQKVMNYLLRR